MQSRIVSYILFVFLICSIASCSRYVDNLVGREIVSSNSILKTYKDSNVIIYKSKIDLRSDNELVKPGSFTTPLPRKIKWYEFLNSEIFAFYYEKNQVIVISLASRDSIVNKDASYVPDEFFLKQIVSRFPIANDKKYDIRKIAFDPKRKHYMLKKGIATVLLYNIKTENFDDYFRYLNGFRVL